MLELTAQNATEILHARGHLPDPHTAKVRELSGGVSNAVFLIEQGADRFVVKQARGKLRVQADWQCSVERIWREVDVLLATTDSLRDKFAHLPQFLWKDQELFAYAMSAADAECEPWKQRLLAGKTDIVLSEIAGSLLGYLHGRTWHRDDLASQFADRTYFAQLRLDPYYLVAAQNYPPLATRLRELVDQTWRERAALVHGDFSPKNLLVTDRSMMLIDFEVGHYGDPAFDVGFFLTHLCLKAIHLAAHREQLFLLIDTFAYYYNARTSQSIPNEDRCQLMQRAVQHLAGCLVARVHGKSPVDYLTPSEQLLAVELSEELFELGATASWQEAFQLLQRELKITPP